MPWLLDTNACIRYLNGRSSKLRAKYDATDPAEIRVCSVVKAELFFGAALANDPVTTLANQRFFLSGDCLDLPSQRRDISYAQCE